MIWPPSMAPQRWLKAAAVVAACQFAVPLGLDGASAAGAQNNIVVIEAVSFQPSSLTLKLGDTVTWKNNDPFPHTVVAVDGAFKSSDLAAGASWKYTLRARGVFPYFCTLHPTMRAVLVVQ